MQMVTTVGTESTFEKLVQNLLILDKARRNLLHLRRGQVGRLGVGRDAEGRAPLAYLHGAKNIVPGLEKAIEGKAVGESVEVTVTPAEGYGDYDRYSPVSFDTT